MPVPEKGVGIYKGAFYGYSAGRATSSGLWSAIEDIYGKHPSFIEAPEGYEFTGEFRCGKEGELYLSSCENGVVTGPLGRNEYESEYNKRLILRKKIEPTLPIGYTAAEVTEKFGPSVLSMFGYRRGLIDFPGFAYTGRIEKLKSDDWFLSTTQGPTKATHNSLGSWLTLVPTTPPLPRIVTYTLTEASEFVSECKGDPDETRYMPREDGSMEPVDTKEVPSQYYYFREEQA